MFAITLLVVVEPFAQAQYFKLHLIAQNSYMRFNIMDKVRNVCSFQNIERVLFRIASPHQLPLINQQ